MKILLGQIGKAAPLVLETEAAALIARMSPAPDSDRQGLINTLVKSLKTDGVWPKLDVLTVLAAHASQPALLNWIANAFNPTLISTPTFVADRGFTGAASKGINSNFNPATAGGHYAQDSAFAGIWVRTTGDGMLLGARDNTSTPLAYTQLARASTSLNVRLNADNSASPNFTVAAGAAFLAANRSASTGVDVYQNGSLVSTGADASTAIPSFPIYILDDNANGALGGNTCTAQAAAYAFGQALTSTDQSNLYAALSTYMTAIGA